MNPKKYCSHMTKVLGCSLIILTAQNVFAFDIKNPAHKELFMGWGGGEKLQQGDYSYCLTAFDLSYPLSRTGWSKDISFQIEPFLALVTSPETNTEAGCSFFLKYTIPWKYAIKPYIRGGTGVVYLFREVEEQGTQFNLVDQLCYGITYERNNLRFSFEFRNRHISNLNLQEPNSGIDSKVWMLGISSFF